MTGHVSDDLPLLLTGDASRDVVMAAANHLRGCEDCRQELVSAVVAHASLTSAHRFAPDVVGSSDTVNVTIDEPAGPSELPDLSALFADAHASAPSPRHRASRTRLRLAAVAAAAAVIVGGGVTYAAVSGDDNIAPSTRTVALQPFGHGLEEHQSGATVKVVGTNKLRIDATKLPRLNDTHLYEVWLTDSGRKSMQSIGYIGDHNTAELAVSPKVMAEYDNIEVSVQRVNQNTYSGISVLRGSYS